MAVKKRKSRRRKSAPKKAPERRDPPEGESSVASIIPDGAESASSADADDAGEAGDGAAGAGARVPPLPPDDEPDDRGEGAASPGAGLGASAREEAESERLKRCMVLQVAFSAMFAAMPLHLGGGSMRPDESGALAEAWELPLRPYWDQIMGPWMGALVTTFAVIGPRVMAARARIDTSGLGDEVRGED